MTVDELLKLLKGQDDKVRTGTWLRAGEVGAPAIRPLAALITQSELEVSRAAKRAMWQIVHSMGQPAAHSEKPMVIGKLVGLLQDDQPSAIRREALWMLSEIGGDESVASVARLLTSNELREDTRLALQRIPGETSLAALKADLATAPEDSKPNIAQSL